MRRSVALAACAAIVVGAGACRGLEPWQEAEYQNIKAAGLPPIEPKSPAAAGALNILPGIGDAYNGVWGAFACNLLLWPISVVWGIPEAVATAENINKQETWTYYYRGDGRPQLEAARGRLGPATNGHP